LGISYNIDMDFTSILPADRIHSRLIDRIAYANGLPMLRSRPEASSAVYS